MTKRAGEFATDPELGPLYSHILADANQEVAQMRSSWKAIGEGN